LAELTTRGRKRLPVGKFALPGRRFPVHDRPHAANAKARASQMFKAGKLSRSQRDKVFAAANKTLKRTAPKGKKK
jgi:hypothetical protein